MVNFAENKVVSLQLQDLIVVTSSTTAQGRHLIIYKHEQLGKILVIDNEIQHIEVFQRFYHEFVIHLPMAFVAEPKHALILGGGSLYAAFELLKYRSLVQIDMVDFDKIVIEEICRNYEHASSVKQDPRLSIEINSLQDFVINTKNKYDFIINDAINFNEEESLYFKVTELLTPNGICSDLIYRNIFESVENQNSIMSIKKHYNIALALLAVPEYPGFLHLLTMWGKAKCINQSLFKSINIDHAEWVLNKNNLTEIFNPVFLPYYLYLPPYLKKYVSI